MTMAKIGGREFCDDNDPFARVYNNLLLHEYIYYFTPGEYLTFTLSLGVIPCQYRRK